MIVELRWILRADPQHLTHGLKPVLQFRRVNKIIRDVGRYPKWWQRILYPAFIEETHVLSEWQDVPEVL